MKGKNLSFASIGNGLIVANSVEKQINTLIDYAAAATSNQASQWNAAADKAHQLFDVLVALRNRATLDEAERRRIASL